MIKLFKDIWLTHNSIDNDFSKCLIENDFNVFWNLLLTQNRRINLECTEDSFVKIFVIFFSNTLVQGKNIDNILNLINLYNLEYKLKTGNSLNFNKELISDIIKNYNLDNDLLNIPKSDYGFEIMLPNYLLSNEPKESLLKHVKWSCWSLLTQELYMYVQDIKRDIFSGYNVVGKDIGLSKKSYDCLYNAIESNLEWRFILDDRLITNFDLEESEESISYFKMFFPTADDLIKIINNHAIAHRDEQSVDSFREPVEMIYQDRYEELLIRDMLNDFRITYASDSLGENLVCTFLSRIYRSYKENDPNKDEVYKMFELRTNLV